MVPAHLYPPKHIVGSCPAWARSSLDQMSLFDLVRMEEATLLCQADPSRCYAEGSVLQKGAMLAQGSKA